MVALQVIGAGFGRTGTMSLKLALERLLGGKCYHMYEVMENLESDVPVWLAASKGEDVDWDTLFENYVAAVDVPASSFWPELAERYPNALIILSIREPEQWWNSASATIFEAISSETPPQLMQWQEMIENIMRQRFTLEVHDREAAIAAYNRHNDKVKAEAPADRLLVWDPSEGWAPICNALGLPIPDEPFPRANTKDDFLKMREERKAQRAAEAAGAQA